MMLILGWLVIGIGVAVAFGSFTAGPGRNVPALWNIVAGAIGGFVGGYLFGSVSPAVFGPGPEFIVSLLGAAVVSLIDVLIVRAIKK